MRSICCAVVVCFLHCAAASFPALAAQGVNDSKAYELRIYTAESGKLADLQKLVGSEGLKAFKRHGIENVFDATVLEDAPIDGTDASNMLILIVGHKGRTAAAKDWLDMDSDRAWTDARSKAEKSGALLAKPVSSLYLDTVSELPTSPIQAVATEGERRVFELRKYNTGAERLPNMIAEFKEGIASILVKSGMTPIIYWKASDQSSFVYLLAHKDREAARASWAAFLPDFRPFITDFNARHAPPVVLGAPAVAPVRRTPDDNRFLIPTAFSPLR